MTTFNRSAFRALLLTYVRISAPNVTDVRIVSVVPASVVVTAEVVTRTPEETQSVRRAIASDAVASNLTEMGASTGLVVMSVLAPLLVTTVEPLVTTPEPLEAEPDTNASNGLMALPLLLSLCASASVLAICLVIYLLVKRSGKRDGMSAPIIANKAQPKTHGMTTPSDLASGSEYKPMNGKMVVVEMGARI